MGFKLPKLLTDVDCEPIGYPGLVVQCWLNLTYDDWEPPEKPQAWETTYYYGLARMIEAVVIPAEYMDNGTALTCTIDGPRAIYDLLETPGFDQTIILWAIQQYQRQRQERMQAETKN
jgi:hypothetical protein